MPWIEVFAVLMVSHLAGDFVLQTEFQALNKRAGLGADPICRRALLAHVATYMLAFVPALVWLVGDLGPGVLAVAVAVALPHAIQDDGRLIRAYALRVKGMDTVEQPVVTILLDQSLHVVALFLLALVVGN